MGPTASATLGEKFGLKLRTILSGDWRVDDDAAGDDDDDNDDVDAIL